MDRELILVIDTGAAATSIEPAILKELGYYDIRYKGTRYRYPVRELARPGAGHGQIGNGPAKVREVNWGFDVEQGPVSMTVPPAATQSITPSPRQPSTAHSEKLSNTAGVEPGGRQRFSTIQPLILHSKRSEVTAGQIGNGPAKVCEVNWGFDVEQGPVSMTVPPSATQSITPSPRQPSTAHSEKLSNTAGVDPGGRQRFSTIQPLILHSKRSEVVTASLRLPVLPRAPSSGPA